MTYKNMIKIVNPKRSEVTIFSVAIDTGLSVMTINRYLKASYAKKGTDKKRRIIANSFIKLFNQSKVA